MGAIAPGLRADLVVLDAECPDLTGRHGDAIANAFIFSGTTNMVRDVLVGGRWAVTEGRHAGQAAARDAYTRALSELLQGDADMATGGGSAKRAAVATTTGIERG
jgi:formimidoylglutamate deiminase